MKPIAVVSIILFLLLSSCATPPSAVPEPQKPLIVTPEPEAAEKAPISDADWLRLLAEYPPLSGEREWAFRLFPQDAVVRVVDDDDLLSLAPTAFEKDRAFYTTDAGAVLLEAPGYDKLLLPLPPDGSTVEAKLERSLDSIIKKGEVRTGHQPKSVTFTPDGKFMYVANLGDFPALGQFRVDPLERIRNLEVPPEFRKSSGFVETAILAERNEIWVSQMNADAVHIFDMASGEHLAAIPVSGGWPKVLLADGNESKVYVSCWKGGSIVEIDADLRREVRSFNVGGTPRGLAFANDGNELWTTKYDGAGVDRINVKDGSLLESYDAAYGRNWAFRHIVHDERRGEYYITAMGVGRVFRLSDNGRWLGSWKVGDKPNTCEISPDGRRLFVSCRGPNNPDTGYLTKGYEYGKVYVIDLESTAVDGWIWGRDQTTGLDVSPDGRFLAFSDFLSNNLELYEIQ